MSYYPAFLDLRGKSVLVVGGGPIAEQKVRQLLEAKAHVRVVSPTLTEGLAGLAGSIDYQPRVFQDGDLDGAWLVIAATDDETLHERIAGLADERRIFCNVVDVTPLCTFIAPAVVRRGPVQVAISTSGLSPALAQQIKRDVENIVGPEHEEMAKILGSWRGYVKQRVEGQTNRAALFQRAMQSGALELLRNGNRSAAKMRIKEMLA